MSDKISQKIIDNVWKHLIIDCDSISVAKRKTKIRYMLPVKLVNNVCRSDAILVDYIIRQRKLKIKEKMFKKLLHNQYFGIISISIKWGSHEIRKLHS